MFAPGYFAEAYYSAEIWPPGFEQPGQQQDTKRRLPKRVKLAGRIGLSDRAVSAPRSILPGRQNLEARITLSANRAKRGRTKSAGRVALPPRRNIPGRRK